MATIEEALTSYLLGTAALTALVGQRIKPFHIPQGATLPCVTYRRIDTPRTLTHQSVGSSSDVVRPRFQFDSWAATELEAQTLNGVLHTALHGKKGTIGTAPTSKKVGAILCDSSFPVEAPEAGMYRWTSQYFIGMEE